MTVDVVIVAYNRFELTDSCLAHLRAQTLPHRVIVLDNGSTDGTSERLAADWPEVHVERVEQNLGFPQACNRAVAAGSGEVVVLLNNDVDCRPEFLERLVEPLDQQPHLGAVVSVMLQPGESLIDSVGLCADVTLAGFPRLQGRPAERAADLSPTLTGPAGTAAAYRRDAWTALGGLDERIFAYMEDFDLTLRLRAAGWGVVDAPDAVGVHLGSATHGHRSAVQRRHGGFGRGYMLRRYRVLRGPHGLRAALTEAIVVMSDLFMSRDLVALQGRVAGWRAARRLPPREHPPDSAIDRSIGFWASLRLRRGVYDRRSG